MITADLVTIAFIPTLLAQAEALRLQYGVETRDGDATFLALGGWRNRANDPDHICGARLGVTVLPVALTDGRYAVTMCWSQAAYDAVVAGEIEGAEILTPEQLTSLLPPQDFDIPEGPE